MKVTIILTLATALVAFAIVGASYLGIPNPLRGRNVREPVGTDNDGCAACGHRDVLELAPGAYLCPSCSYEGGPNLARVKWLAEMATLKERPEEEQQAVRHAALEEGRLLIAVAEGELSLADGFLQRAAEIHARPAYARSKDDRGHIEELHRLADAAVTAGISPTLEAISQLETVEFLDSGASSLEPLRSALVEASSVQLERAAIEQALEQLRPVAEPT